MPAATLSRLRSYSALEMAGTVRTTGLAIRFRRSVGGKVPDRLRDLLRARHEELLLGPVEGHGRDVRRGDTCHRAVEVVEFVLGDDRRNLAAEPAGEVVLVH